MDLPMTENHRKTLEKCRVQLVRDLVPDDVLDHLISGGIVTPDEQEDIMALKKRKEKVRFILDLLPKRGDKAFVTFKEALQEPDSGHSHLYKLLDGSLEFMALPTSIDVTDWNPSKNTEPMGLDTATDSDVVMETAPISSQIAGHDVPELTSRTPRNPTLIVSEQQLSKLAGSISEEWERLGVELEICRNDIYRFKVENQFNVWAQAHAMLVKWRKREYKNATIGVLVAKCQKVGVGKEAYEFLMNVKPLTA